MTTALEFVRGLGLGWNLGNTFDPVPLNDERNKTITTGEVWTPEDQQRLWSNKPFTRDCAFFVKEAGFDTIRIPVTWKDWQDPYTGNVDPVWMAAVQEAVDWSYEAGLNVLAEHDSDWCTPVDVWGGDEEVAAVEAIYQEARTMSVAQ
ncbi:cellulase family glycosylhydrolase [Bifidobacterium dentium]|uniref:cellulase family glycosylhydrolase n=1 Tax=Bifidobacterium dentium TaxID=1689 RepID=UPI003D1788C9